MLQRYCFNGCLASISYVVICVFVLFCVGVDLGLLLSGKNKLKALYPFIHQCCSRFTYSWAWFSVLNYKHYKMCLF